MKFLKSSVIATGALFLALIATSASASTVTLSKQAGASGIFDGAYANVAVTAAPYGTTNTSPNAFNAPAGGFRVTDGTTDFIAWCVDVEHYLRLPGRYEDTTTPFTNTLRGAFSPAVKSNIENLFEVNFPTLNVNNGLESAGFQLALWELVYETQAVFDAGAGAFMSTTAAVVAAANGFLASLGSPIAQNYNVVYYESLENSQNLVSVTPVPLPAAIWMFGLGLAGLYGASRRKKS